MDTKNKAGEKPPTRNKEETVKISMDGPITIETVEDAEKLIMAALAASGYRQEVAAIPGPTVGELLSGNGDVHAPTAEKYLAEHGPTGSCSPG